MPHDPEHWLYRFRPREWLRAAVSELSRAEEAFERRDRRGGMAGCRRAAGMAINAILALADEPAESYGRSYMDHLMALEREASAPEAVREAARLLTHTPLPGGEVVVLRTLATDPRLVDAARTVMAHALALVLRTEPLPQPN